MDNLLLSWNLLIVVFFGVVITYSFITGRNLTIKMIIAAYMAILTSDGAGNVFNQYLRPAAPALEGAAGDEVLVLLKIFIFVLVIVLLIIKGGFHVDVLPESSLITRLLSNLVFGFLNAGLVVSTLLVYLTNGSFVAGTVQKALESPLYLESQMVQTMIDNYNIWFALPAVAIVLISFLEPRAE